MHAENIRRSEDGSATGNCGPQPWAIGNTTHLKTSGHAIVKEMNDRDWALIEEWSEPEASMLPSERRPARMLAIRTGRRRACELHCWVIPAQSRTRTFGSTSWSAVGASQR